MAGNRKSALSFALGKFATDQTRQDTLMVCHAVLSTAMTEAALEKDTTLGETRAYARAIKLIEEQLGNSYSAVPPLPRTHFVSSKDDIPRTTK